VTGYFVTDLRQHGIGVRCYVRLLETAVVEVVAAYGVRGFTTADPGVWVGDDGDRKVCAVGVQMRRNVTAYGVGLNVCGAPLRWWFQRIVPCGLRGKRATSIDQEAPPRSGGRPECGEVARRLAEVLGRRLGREVREIGVEGTGVITASEWAEVVEREWEVVRRRVAEAGETLEEVKRREERERMEESIPSEATPAL
jgi:lipoate-protein ligase B